MSNKPAHSIRLSPVKATIWANQREQNESSDGRPFYTVSFTRTYKDAAGNWQDSTNFSRDDLLLLAKLADEAHSWIYSRQAPKEA
jgi:hypothetical protein